MCGCQPRSGPLRARFHLFDAKLSGAHPLLNVGHEERDDFGETVQVRLRRISARLGRRNWIKGADVGEKRRRDERRPRIGWNVIGDGVAEPDEGGRALLDIGVGKGYILGDARIFEKSLLACLGRRKGKFSLLASSDKGWSSLRRWS